MVDLPRSQWEHYIDEWIQSEIDRHMLKRSLLDGVKLSVISYEVNLSYDQTKRRFKKAKMRLLKKVENDIIKGAKG